jgi:hypothetical protein
MFRDPIGLMTELTPMLYQNDSRGLLNQTGSNTVGSVLSILSW